MDCTALQREERHSASTAEQDIIKDRPQLHGRSLTEQVVSAYKNQFFRSKLKPRGNHATAHPRVCAWPESQTSSWGHGKRIETCRDPSQRAEQRKACTEGCGVQRHRSPTERRPDPQRIPQRRETQGTAHRIVGFALTSNLQHHLKTFTKSPHNQLSVPVAARYPWPAGVKWSCWTGLPSSSLSPDTASCADLRPRAAVPRFGLCEGAWGGTAQTILHALKALHHSPTGWTQTLLTANLHTGLKSGRLTTN